MDSVFQNTSFDTFMHAFLLGKYKRGELLDHRVYIILTFRIIDSAEVFPRSICTSSRSDQH